MSERQFLLLATIAAALALALVWRRRRVTKRCAAEQRFAFLNTEPVAKWADQSDIFFEALGMPRHMWDEFRCYDGEFPSMNELRTRYSGLLVTGSHFSVYEPDLDWMPQLLQVLRECASLPHLRVIGCCFGCQSVALALGGTVGPNPDGGFVLRNEQVLLSLPMRTALLSQTSRAVNLGEAAAAAVPLDGDCSACSVDSGQSSRVGAVKPLSAVQLLSSHGDQVTRLPPGAELLGWSEGSPHELFLCGPHKNMLCCQAHPEFEPAHIIERILPAVLAKGRITHAQAAATAVSLEQPLHSSLLRALYKNFLLQATGLLSDGCGHGRGR